MHPLDAAVGAGKTEVSVARQIESDSTVVRADVDES